MVVSLIGFAALLALILVVRVPIAFALAVVGFLGYWAIVGLTPALALSAQIFTDTVMNYSLSVVPLFILMGNLVSKAGLSHELYAASHAFLGHRRGGLAMATIVACGGFSAICGSSLATAATMSKVALPPMRRYGYDDSLATASIASGGTLGILIPPSVILVIYGFLTETSIRELFAAGFLPGLLGVLLYIVAVKYAVARRPESGPRAERVPWHERWIALSGVLGTVALFIVVIGGIYVGLFTPTEAAGVGAVGALVIALFRRNLDWKSFLEVLVDTARTTAMLFTILIGAVIFAEFVNRAGLPEGLKDLVTGFAVTPMVVMLIIIAIYIVLGCVFESLSMLLLTIPVFFPIVVGLDFGLTKNEVAVWFGIIAVVVTEISLITPPVGLNVFVLSSVLPDVKTSTIFKGVTPFWVVDIVRLAILLMIPTIALLLPNWFYHCRTKTSFPYSYICPAKTKAQLPIAPADGKPKIYAVATQRLQAPSSPSP
jgi:tripartite ATP-independent transporter DctM subunit